MGTHGRWRTGWLAICSLMIVALIGSALVSPLAAQEATAPDAGDRVTPTPVIGSASGQPSAQTDTSEGQEAADSGANTSLETSQPQQSTQQQQSSQQDQSQQTAQPQQNQQAAPSGGVPDPVLAQGLIYLSGEDVVWQVREVEVTESEGVTGNARVIYQQEGNSIIRNDVTGKRARLEPGEAYFASSGDPYSTFADGNGPATMWIFEISNSNVVGEGAFYLSPNVGGYGEAVYDFEFTRHVVGAGGSSEITAGDGPSMVMVLRGQVDVTDDNGSSALGERDGLIVNGNATIEGTSGQAVIVSMTVGPTVSDDSAAPAEAVETPSPDSSDETSTVTTEAEASEPPQSVAPAASGEFATSIQVGVESDVGITMYVDGVLVYDGWLSAGDWTAYYTGSVFEVYTTSGANTLFQNSCGGDPFYMGYESGDAYYLLEATADSCPPVE